MTSTLTWKEFKELVDREIQEEGVIRISKYHT